MTSLSARFLLAVCFFATVLALSVKADTRKTLSLSEPRTVAPNPRPKSLVATVTLADVGFGYGLRLANLGGRREVFIPLPQGVEMTASELVLTLDDVSAHDARRSLEVIVNDRSVSSLALDGHSMGRVVRIPLPDMVARDGFLKLAFLYSGAATQDRCIDVRYVGDSVTVRPESV